MKRLFQEAKSELQNIINPHKPSHDRPSHPHTHHDSQSDQPRRIAPPSPADIFRYRYHHGTNLGSVYVLERWLSPSMFPDDAPSNQSSELEAVKAWVERIGIQATKSKFEEHWANAVTDGDLDWLCNVAKCTTIRLPIGYFSLSSELTQSTPFAPYASIYESAWPSIVTLIHRLRARSIGTLLDLHALPGGANNSDHSGTNASTASLWIRSSNRTLGIQSCEFLARQITQHHLDNVTGIQIVNEADHDAPNMYPWYDQCISTISSINPTIPVYISDAWNLSNAISYTLSKNTPFPTQPTCPVLIDTHLYWCFSDADKAKSPQQVIGEVTSKLSALDGKEGNVTDRGAVQVIIGEYSCVLSEDSWARRGSAQKEELVKQFGRVQCQYYQHRAGGAFFWTWKMDWYPGGEWGFLSQTSTTSIYPPPSTPPSSLSTTLQTAHDRRDELLRVALFEHVQYWTRTCPGQHFEHQKYSDGWEVGFDDALAFFEGRGVGGGNRIGCLEVWALKRIRESGLRGGFVWEFEQGFRRGVGDFEGVRDG